jgi:carbonic anhydrase
MLVLVRNETDAARIIRVVGLISVALVIVLIIRYFMNKAAKKRTLAMRATATKFGWSFFPEARLDCIPGLERFALFDQGRGKKILNLMAGEAEGIKAFAFDYQYRTGSGKYRTIHDQTVVYLEPANVNLPYFLLQPEGLLTKIAGAIGCGDINLGQRPEFSTRFMLRGQDEVAIRQMFNDRLLALYEGYPEMSTEAGGNQFFLYRAGGNCQPYQIQAYVGLALLIVKSMQSA